MGTSTKCRLFPKVIRYFTSPGHRSSIAVPMTFLPAVKLDDCWYKLVPFLLKDFPGFCGRNKSRDLICICHTCRYYEICKLTSLSKFYAFMALFSEDRPPPTFLMK